MTQSRDTTAPIAVTGGCLCGAVRFSATIREPHATACHCSMCRRWAGGISTFVEAVGSPQFTGSDAIGHYKASTWGERAFCTKCGSSLYWKLTGKDHYTLSAGALDDQNQLRLTHEIFIEDKPSYYTFADDTVKQTGEEATAAFLSQSE